MLFSCPAPAPAWADALWQGHCALQLSTLKPNKVHHFSETPVILAPNRSFLSTKSTILAHLEVVEVPQCDAGDVRVYYEFCIQNDELCIKNDEFCSKNDGF